MKKKSTYTDSDFITDNNLSFETRGFMMYLRIKIRKFISNEDVQIDQQELIDRAVETIYSELDDEQKELMVKVTAELVKNNYEIGA